MKACLLLVKSCKYHAEQSYFLAQNQAPIRTCWGVKQGTTHEQLTNLRWQDNIKRNDELSQ